MRVDATCPNCSTVNTMSETFIGAPCIVCGTWVNAPPMRPVFIRGRFP